MKASQRRRQQFATNSAEPAPRSFTVNTDEYTLRQMTRAREAILSGRFGALDNKRPRAWDQYGYPEQIAFTALLQAYKRGGAAKGAVHKLLDKCWQDVPRIKQPKADKETEWETRAANVLKAAKAWPKLRDLDRRNMVGRYAAVIYRIADSRSLREPLGRGKLVDLVPLYEDQLKVSAWDSDQASAEYGKPKMFQYQSRRLTSGVDQQGAPIEWVDVHPSRVQLLAEGSVGDFLDGVPLLEAGFNTLIDLEKISGGSAEGYLKNSSRQIVVNFDANASVQHMAASPGVANPTGTQISDALNDKVKDLNRNVDSAMLLQGGEATTLQTTMHDPEGPFMVAANLFAASVQIPFTIIFGQQTGRLASDEDQSDFCSRAHSRRVNELTPMIEEFIIRMQAAGAIDEGEFEVQWAPLDAPGDDDKFALLGKATAAMQQASAAGLMEPIFDTNELRGIVDFEERTDDGMPEEGDLTPEEIAAAAAAQAAGQRATPAPTAAPRPRLAA